MAKNVAQLIKINVHPTDWESSPESERIAIDLMGHLMPKVYVQVVEIFSLPENTNIEPTIKSMVAGLEFALSQYPVLCGTLRSDDSNGEMWVEKKRESTVSLYVKHMTGEGEFPSFEELEKNHFAANRLPSNKLIPEGAIRKPIYSPLGNDDAEIHMATFQINIIRGGLVLGLAVHHVLSDVTGCDGFLTTWAQNSTAASCGEPFIPVDEPFTFKGSALDVPKPTAEEAEKLKDAYPIIKVGTGPPPLQPAEFKMPDIACQMFHFPKSKAEALKDRLSKDVNEGWISRYDAFLALLWSRATIARLPLLQPDLDSDVTLMHAVDTRKYWDPLLPDRFLGNGAWGARCQPLSIRDVIAPENIAQLATRIRASIQELSPDYLHGLLQWTASVEDKRHFVFDHHAFMGMDFGGTSWAGMSAYEKHDFGFGCPKALRWPNPQHDGFVFVFPSRAAQMPAAADEGIELCVCLEKSCMERLMKDEMLLTYAELRG
ncbi:transferase family-domain-containing protein [Paraphoma chrysanthemicola]|nr:transferase family-domain-containing protein [Paraphoma chrysanthemicola]